MKDEAIGRAKTVLVSDEGPATITTIIAHTTDNKNPEKINFTGPVIFDNEVKNHINETIIPIVENIIKLLEILSPPSFELSCVNIGATSSSDIGITVKGFSADLSIFIALLSAGLSLPIPQDIVLTGHIASPKGDISQVKHLTEKAEAALIDKTISGFIYPNLDLDSSLKTLKPKEYQQSEAAIRSCRGKIKSHKVNNILDVLEKILNPENIVLSSLEKGFFETKILEKEKNLIGWIATFLSHSNTSRFWKALELNLMAGNINKCHTLIKVFSDYYIERKKYPCSFGEKLHKIVLSLPLYIKRTPKLFPLLPKDRFIKLIQNVSEKDHNDFTFLDNALYGETSTQSRLSDSNDNKKSVINNTTDKLNYILKQINPDLIRSTITQVYDEARASFILNKVTVETHEEFLDYLTAFYAHIYRYTNKIDQPIDKNALDSESLNIFNKTFNDKTKYNEALAESKNGTKGGMRYIFDIITEYLKQVAAEKHIIKIFRETIDPLEYQNRVTIIKEILYREKGNLPKELSSQPPEKYAVDYEDIIKAYAQSKTNLISILRRL